MVPEVGISTAGSSGSAGPGPSSSPGAANSSGSSASVTTSLGCTCAEQALELGRGLARVHRHVDGAQVGGREPEEHVARVVARRGEHEVALRHPALGQARGGGRDPLACLRRMCTSRPRRTARAYRERRRPQPRTAAGLSGGQRRCAQDTHQTGAPSAGPGPNPGPPGPGRPPRWWGIGGGSCSRALATSSAESSKRSARNLASAWLCSLAQAVRSGAQLSQRACAAQRGSRPAPRPAGVAASRAPGACRRAPGAPRRAPCARPSRPRRARRPAPERSPRDAAACRPSSLSRAAFTLSASTSSASASLAAKRVSCCWCSCSNAASHLVGRDAERLGQGGGELVAATRLLALVEGAERLRQLAGAHAELVGQALGSRAAGPSPRSRAGRRGGSRCPSPGRCPRWPCRRRPGCRVHSRPTRPQARLRRR